MFQSKDASEDGIDLALKQGLTLQKEIYGPNGRCFWKICSSLDVISGST